MSVLNSISIDFDYEIMPDDSEYDFSFKIIIIGDSGVGKSCLANKGTKNIFDDKYNTTIGFEFFSFHIKIDEKIVKLQIWDTCGQEVYRSLISNFYRNTSLAIIVYAVNNKQSFENIGIWLKELKINSNPDVKLFLIGNKIDLDDKRIIKTEEGEAYSKENNFNKFIETSAKSGINAQQIFIEAAKILYDNYILFCKDYDMTSQVINTKSTSTLKRKNEDYRKNNKKKKCC